MALLCYLGYRADEITEIFKNFRQEHLVHFEIDRNGLSDSHSLKTAFDYLIVKKLESICCEYHIDFPQGKITFVILDEIRKQCPGAGIGEELIVTATNKKQRTTRYFSLQTSPDMEVSEAVKISASMPVLFKPTLIDNEEYNDGGVLLNLPTRHIKDDRTTLLCSANGTNLKVLPFQFDNGTERAVIDKVMEDIPRENFVLNWFYGMVTGVSDPVSGWVQDRVELRKYSSQAVLINVGPVTSTNFTVEDTIRERMIKCGYDAMKEYLSTRYEFCEGRYVSHEWMHCTFESLGDLLSYCCYRGDKTWFETVNNLIVHADLPNTTALRKHSLNLRNLYFSTSSESTSMLGIEREEITPITFFNNPIVGLMMDESECKNHKVLLNLYPIMLKMVPEMVITSSDKKFLNKARHSFSLHAPFKCLVHFDSIQNERHLVLSIFITIYKEFMSNPDDVFFEHLKRFELALGFRIELSDKRLYGKWQFNFEESIQLLNLLSENRLDEVTEVALIFENKRQEAYQLEHGVPESPKSCCLA